MPHIFCVFSVPIVLQAVIAAWFIVTAIRLSYWDLKFHRLPNPLVLTTLVISLIGFTSLAAAQGSWHRLLDAALGAATLMLLYFLAHVLGGMGMGDVKYASVTGLYLGWLGWGFIWWGTFIAFFGAAILVCARSCVPVLAQRRRNAIPFGPFMALGVVATAPMAWV